MNLLQLKSVMLVAECGTLTKAAERLQLTQPALSRQVRALEAELGCAVFERHGRGMRLTDAGRDVAMRAARIYAEMDAIAARVESASGSLSGRCSVGLPPTVAGVVAAPLATTFRRAHPGVELRIATAFTGYLKDWLLRGEVDLAILYDPQLNNAARTQPLLTECLALVGPATAAHSASEVPFTHLPGYTLCLPSSRHGLRNVIDRCAESAGISLHAAVEADSLSTLKALVRAGLGYTLLPLVAIQDDVRAGEMAAAPVIDPVPTRRLVLATSRHRPFSQIIRFASDSLLRLVTDLVSRQLWPGRPPT